MKFKVAKNNKSVSREPKGIKDIQHKLFKSNQPFGCPGAHNGGRIRVVQVDIFG